MEQPKDKTVSSGKIFTRNRGHTYQSSFRIRVCQKHVVVQGIVKRIEMGANRYTGYDQPNANGTQGPPEL